MSTTDNGFDPTAGFRQPFRSSMDAANQFEKMTDQQLDMFVGNMVTTRGQFFQKMMDPRRNYDSECGYPETVEIKPEDYRTLYDRESTAERVVQLLPMESWQVQPTVYEDEDSETQTPFEQAWDDLSRSLRDVMGNSWYQDEEGSPIWEHLLRADVQSGIGSFGLLLMGFNDGMPLDTPLPGFEGDIQPMGTDAQYGSSGFSNPLGNSDQYFQLDLFASDGSLNTERSNWGSLVNNPNPLGNFDGTNQTYQQGLFDPVGQPQDAESELDDSEEVGTDDSQSEGLKLVFLRTFDESLVKITRYETNKQSPRYGQPTMYLVTLNDPNEQHGGVGLSLATANVHWSRVIHVADNLGCSEIFGVPRLRPVFNKVLNLVKLYGGSAEMYWRGAFPGLSFETNPNLGGDVQIDKGKLQAQAERYFNTLQRYIAMEGMTVKTISPQVVDPSTQITTQLNAIALALGCPMRKFMGSEVGQLASGQDDATWNDRLMHRQVNYLTPRLIVPFIDRLIILGVLPEPAGYSISWPDLNTVTPDKRATLAGQRTTAMAGYISGGVDVLMGPQDYLTRELGYTEDEATTILENALEHTEAANPHLEEGDAVAGHTPPEPEPDPSEIYLGPDGKPVDQVVMKGKKLQPNKPKDDKKPVKNSDAAEWRAMDKQFVRNLQPRLLKARTPWYPTYVRNVNPNHDDHGRFSGSSGGGKLRLTKRHIEILKELAKKGKVGPKKMYEIAQHIGGLMDKHDVPYRVFNSAKQLHRFVINYQVGYDPNEARDQYGKWTTEGMMSKPERKSPKRIRRVEKMQAAHDEAILSTVKTWKPKAGGKYVKADKAIEYPHILPSEKQSELKKLQRVKANDIEGYTQARQQEAYRKAYGKTLPGQLGVTPEGFTMKTADTAGKASSELLNKTANRIVKQAVKETKIKAARVTAWGTQGTKNKPWRQEFKSEDSLRRWANNNKATIHGVQHHKAEVTKAVRKGLRQFAADALTVTVKHGGKAAKETVSLAIKLAIEKTLRQQFGLPGTLNSLSEPTFNHLLYLTQDLYRKVPELLINYSADEPRDRTGKWTSGGGVSRVPVVRTGLSSTHPAEPKESRLVKLGKGVTGFSAGALATASGDALGQSIGGGIGGALGGGLGALAGIVARSPSMAVQGGLRGAKVGQAVGRFAGGALGGSAGALASVEASKAVLGEGSTRATELGSGAGALVGWGLWAHSTGLLKGLGEKAGQAVGRRIEKHMNSPEMQRQIEEMFKVLEHRAIPAAEREAMLRAEVQSAIKAGMSNEAVVKPIKPATSKILKEVLGKRKYEVLQHTIHAVVVQAVRPKAKE